jgi:N-methylhydantoinase B
LPGAFSETILLRSNGEVYKMRKETVTIRKGDSVRVVTSGGGGWGNPLERDSEWVFRDVQNGAVSIERAKEVYGVVIDEVNMEVDQGETQKVRQERRSST